MDAKRLGLGAVLVGFAGLTTYSVVTQGYVGFFEALMANAATVTASVDLVIALTLVMVWMGRDAKAHDIPALPYVLLTLTLGSIGPLAYLIHRAGREHNSVPSPARAPLAAR